MPDAPVAHHTLRVSVTVESIWQHTCISLCLATLDDLLVTQTSRSTCGPRGSSLFLGLSARSLFLHRFAIHPCCLDNSAVKFRNSCFAQVHLDNVTAFITLYSVLYVCIFFSFCFHLVYLLVSFCVIRFNPAC